MRLGSPSIPTLGLLTISLLWGTTFVAVKSGLADSSPLLFVGIRFTVATAAALPLLRSRAALRRALPVGIPLGLVLAGGYATQTLGLMTTSPARSAFLTAMNVVIVPILAIPVLRRRVRRFSLMGLALTIPGLWLLTNPGGGGWVRGDAWTLACAFFFALHVVLVNRWGRSCDTSGLLVAQLLVTGIVCLVAAPLVEPIRFVPTGQLVGALLVTGVLATTGVTWLQLRYQPRVDATRAALIYTTEPVFATFFSWALIGEVLPRAGWIGGGLILVGMVLSEIGSGGKADPAGSPIGGR